MLKNKGVILITTLLFVSLIVMFSVMVAQQGKQAIQSGSMYSQNEQAYLAALSGIEYARSRLYNDKHWMDSVKSSDNCKYTNVNAAVEYNGDNVTGYLGGADAGDCKAYFTMSFAVPESSQKLTDGFNPSPNTNSCPYSSLNNLDDSKNNDNGFYRRDVPPGSCYIVSKGVCGKSVRYVETLLWSEGPSALDGGTTIGGDITIESASHLKKHPDKTFVNIKTKDDNRAANITAFDPTDGISSKNITIKTKNSYYERALNNSNRVIANAGNIELDNTGYENLSEEYKKYLTLNNNFIVPSFESDATMKDFKTVYASSSALPSGTYVFVKSTSNEHGTWKYTPNITAQTSSVYAQLQDDDQVSLSGILSDLNSADLQDLSEINLPEGISFSKQKNGKKKSTGVVQITDNIAVNGDVRFLVVEDSGGGDNTDKYEISETTVDFRINSDDKPKFTPTFSSVGGDIDIHGEIKGNGNIFSTTGNVAFNSGSELEAGKDSDSIAVYANDKIYIKPAFNISEETALEAGIIKPPGSNNQSGSNNPPGTGSPTGSENSQLINLTVNFQTGANSEHLNDVQVQVTSDDSIFTLSNPVYNENNIDTFYFRDDKFYLNPGYGHQMAYDKLYIIDQGNMYQLVFKKLNFNPNETFVPTVGDGGVGVGKPIINSSLGSAQCEIEVKQVKYLGNTSSLGTITLTYTADSEVSSTLDGSVSNYFSVNGDDASVSTEVSAEELEYAPIIDNVNKIITLSNARDSKFTGTLFSKTGGIFINGGQGKFDITGALITNNGNLTMKNMKNVDLRYDPDYVPFFKDLGVVTSYSFISAF